MKASYRKTKIGYYPVIIFDDKSRMTKRLNCLTKDIAIKVAHNSIFEINNYQEKNEKVITN